MSVLWARNRKTFSELKDLGEANKKMKRVWRTRDKFGGSFEVYVLDRNNKIAEDLIMFV